MRKTDLEASTYQNKPAYRYIRKADKLPALHESEPAPTAHIKLFDPTGSWTWYIAEYDPESRAAYGYVDGEFGEFGSIYMPELVEFRGLYGLPIERDLWWTPKPLSECNNRRGDGAGNDVYTLRSETVR